LINIFDIPQGLQAYETVICVIELVEFEGGFVPLPHCKGLQFPPVIQVMKDVFNV